MLADDTIVAVATAPGQGALALIRISGGQAHDIVHRHVRPWPATIRRATLCTVHGVDDVILDQAVMTVFEAPHSFTGEDLIEITTHGGTVIPTLVVAALIGSGAREALPGEFTRRAVLNGKLDIVQAEAVGDLINATSRAMHATAIRQLNGGLSRRVAVLREQVIALETLIAYDIDFPEEDDGPVSRERVIQATNDVQQALDGLLATAPAGELVRNGVVVVIAGAPNAGKSSLFNALLGAERAIVTAIPGTTRDAIEAVIDTDRWPIRLVDTAGLRETKDVIEQSGIEVSTRYLTAAHLVLACGETDVAMDQAVDMVAELTTAPVIGIRTKADLGISHAPVRVSAETGTGLATVVDVMCTALSEHYGVLTPDTPVLTRERHRYAISAARDEIAAFDQTWRNERLPAPVAAVHLRAAVHALEDVVGMVDVEDIFDRLFQTFCIGK